MAILALVALLCAVSGVLAHTHGSFGSERDCAACTTVHVPATESPAISVDVPTAYAPPVVDETGLRQAAVTRDAVSPRAPPVC